MALEPKKLSEFNPIDYVPVGSYVFGYDPNAATAAQRNVIIAAEALGQGGGIGGTGGGTGDVSKEQLYDVLELISEMQNKTIKGRNYYVDTFGDNTGLDLTQSVTVIREPGGKKLTPNSKDPSVLLHFDAPVNTTTIVDVNEHVMLLQGPGSFSKISSQFPNFGNTLDLNNGNYINSPDSEDYGVGTGDFTVEFFAFSVSIVSGVGYTPILDTRTTNGINGLGAGQGFSIDLVQSGLGFNLQFTAGVNDSFKLKGDIVAFTGTDPFRHGVVERKNGIITIYIDGVIDKQASYPDDLGSVGRFRFGADVDSQFYANGYFDEFRFIKKAMYGGAFTVPTEPFTKQPASAKFVAVSNPWTSVDVPTAIGLRVLARPLDSVPGEPDPIPNVDLVGSVSRDDGDTWSIVTFAASYKRTDGHLVLVAPAVDVTAHAAEKAIRYKLEVPTDRYVEVSSVLEYLS